MSASLNELQTEVIELAAESFEAFCEDLSGMFGSDLSVEQQDVFTADAKNLRKQFKGLVAISKVKAEGALTGDFYLAFDQDGLFTLGGFIIMLPEQRIMDLRKTGREKEANDMRDAVGETGNLLVGSWDRTFREAMAEHKHFVQSTTFVGKPWLKPQETIGLTDEPIVCAIYQMKIDPFPPFTCGVIFPQSVFGTSEQAAEEEPAAERITEKQPEQPPAQQRQPKDKQPQPQQPQPEPATEPAAKSQEVAQPSSEESKPEPVAEEQVVEKESSATGQSKPEEKVAKKQEPAVEEPVSEELTAVESQSAAEEQSVAAPDAPAEKTSDATPADQVAAAAEPQQGPVSDAIRKMTHSFDFETAARNLMTCAHDIMQTDVLWCSGDDTVESACQKMQQAEGGYLLIGEPGKLEGIVSRSDIAAAVSPYLRPIFAKWRRPTDDATLQIRLKWIMTKPVTTIDPQMPVIRIMAKMREQGKRAFPVADDSGKVLGLVAVYDLFASLLAADSEIQFIGKAGQTPPLA